LSKIEFKPNSFILIDEAQNAIIGASAAMKKALYDALSHLLCKQTHHSRLFTVIILQGLFKTTFYSLLGLAQSVCVGSLFNQAEQTLRHAGLTDKVLQRAKALLKIYKENKNFLLVYHNPSAFHKHHSFLYTCLTNLPAFAICIGDERTSSLAFPTVPRSRTATVKMTSELGETMSALAQDDTLKECTYALVPLGSVLLHEEGEPEQANTSTASIDERDRNVRDMIIQCWGISEQKPYKRFVCESCRLKLIMLSYIVYLIYFRLWNFIKKVESFQSDTEGNVIYFNGHTLSTFTLLDECLKRGGNFGQKCNKIDADTRECVPYVAELFKTKLFPKKLVKNPKLRRLAMKHRA